MPQFYDENGNPVDPYADPDEQYGQATEPPQTRNPVRDQLRRTEAKLREAEKRIGELEPQARRLSFLEAGVDMEHPMASYFIDGYKGEVTTEAVRTAAEAANLLKPQMQQQVTPQQQAVQMQQQVPGQQFPTPQQQQVGVPDAFQQAQTAYRAMQQATDATMPGTRDFDAEMRSAPNQQEANRILQEKHATLGLLGVPAIVHD